MISTNSLIVDERFTSTPNAAVLESEVLHHPTMVSVVAGANPHGVPEPPSEGTEEFAAQSQAFTQVRHDVSRGVWPGWYFGQLGLDEGVPKRFADVGIRGSAAATRAAEFVEMDHPIGLHQLWDGADVLSETNGFKIETGHGAVGGDQFIVNRSFDAIVAGAVAAASRAAFQVKYYYSYPRPRHHFRAGPVVQQYECPAHWSYVAGHGAHFGAVFAAWEGCLDMSDELVEELRIEALHAAHYRTLAGMHWPIDNEAGFELGRTVATAYIDSVSTALQSRM